MVMRLRFAMHGVRNNRILHLVAVNQRKRRNARPAELLGIFHPRLGPDQTTKMVEWSVDRIRYWLSVGAQPTKSVERLLRRGNILHDRPTQANHSVETPKLDPSQTTTMSAQAPTSSAP